MYYCYEHAVNKCDSSLSLKYCEWLRLVVNGLERWQMTNEWILIPNTHFLPCNKDWGKRRREIQNEKKRVLLSNFFNCREHQRLESFQSIFNKWVLTNHTGTNYFLGRNRCYVCQDYENYFELIVKGSFNRYYSLSKYLKAQTNSNLARKVVLKYCSE